MRPGAAGTTVDLDGLCIGGQLDGALVEAGCAWNCICLAGVVTLAMSELGVEPEPDEAVVDMLVSVWLIDIS